MHADRAVLVEHHEVVVGAFHDLEVVETDDTLVLCLDDWLLEGLAGGATDVERPHGQLGSRLADRLRGDDTHRFTQLDGEPGGEVAAVTLSANTPLGLTSQRRADLELLQTDFLERGCGVLIDDLSGGDHSVASDRVFHGLAAGAPNDAGGKADHLLIPFINRADDDSVNRSAVFLGDDDILGSIDQLTREVAGVGRLERGIRESFASSMGRDEILENGQAFAEV